MKKTKIKQRFANAADAFFADENSIENNLESFGNQTNSWREDTRSNSFQKNSSLETILKQVFLFFPGTFVLYILSMGLTAMFVGSWFRFSELNLRVGIGWVMLLFLASMLMTWLGLGDVRKTKHLIIPGSIISVGVVVGAVVGVLITIPFYGRLFFRDSFPLYIFPLALIAPFLAKSLVDRKEEKLKL